MICQFCNFEGLRPNSISSEVMGVLVSHNPEKPTPNRFGAPKGRQLSVDVKPYFLENVIGVVRIFQNTVNEVLQPVMESDNQLLKRMVVSRLAEKPSSPAWTAPSSTDIWSTGNNFSLDKRFITNKKPAR